MLNCTQGGTMPTYEYRCEKCGHTFTTVLSLNEHDKGRPPCPKCKSKKVEQVFSGVSVKTSRKS
jgi:putative FmdB family regulatory protein